MWPAICCIRLICLSFSVSANFTTKLEDAPCNKREKIFQIKNWVEINPFFCLQRSQSKRNFCESHLKFPLLKSFLSVLQMIILLSEGDEMLKSIKNYLTWIGDKERDRDGERKVERRWKGGSKFNKISLMKAETFKILNCIWMESDMKDEDDFILGWWRQKYTEEVFKKGMKESREFLLSWKLLRSFFVFSFR